jgi:hypothetical protein
MKKLLLSATLVATMLAVQPPARSDERRHDDDKLTLAVFGDWPYNANLLANASLLVDSVNADRAVSRVIHVGDIHSGSFACTSAGILPPIPASNPGWNQRIYYQFQQFRMPVVYTPGDNEWTDCHKTKEFSSGAPLNELASVRSLFFARPGKTLGRDEKDVWSQAEYYDPAHPADAQFVENVIWEDAKTIFVTLNMPGSNNDTLPWTGSFADATAQAKEVAERSDADIRWLQAAFKLASDRRAKAVVIALQADMWDPAAAVSGGDGLGGYTAFVQKLAALTLGFGRPVLLLNGDSHVFGSDHPLQDPNSATGMIHHTTAVSNLTRITVQGSTNKPAEWLRLTIDPEKWSVFSWTNVSYCIDPLSSCK